MAVYLGPISEFDTGQIKVEYDERGEPICDNMGWPIIHPYSDLPGGQEVAGTSITGHYQDKDKDVTRQVVEALPGTREHLVKHPTDPAYGNIPRVECPHCKGKSLLAGGKTKEPWLCAITEGGKAIPKTKEEEPKKFDWGPIVGGIFFASVIFLVVGGAWATRPGVGEASIDHYDRVHGLVERHPEIYKPITAKALEDGVLTYREAWDIYDYEKQIARENAAIRTINILNKE